MNHLFATTPANHNISVFDGQPLQLEVTPAQLEALLLLGIDLEVGPCPSSG